MSNEQWTIVEEGEGTRDGSGVLPWTGIYATLEEAIEAVNGNYRSTFGEDSPTVDTTSVGFGSWSNPENRKRNIVHTDSDQQSIYHFIQHSE